MNSTVNNFYAYMHRRADNGLPFYVGSGRHRRAWSRSGRSEEWKNIVGNHGLLIEIFSFGLSEQAATDFEEEMIAKMKANGHQLIDE
jgi:cobalamin biosynthesis Co2+ chelatase CbiK